RSTIVSASEVALARLTASRRDSLPATWTSSKLLAMKVAGTSRPSNGSKQRRFLLQAGDGGLGDRANQGRAGMMGLLAAPNGRGNAEVMAPAAGCPGGTGRRTLS